MIKKKSFLKRLFGLPKMWEKQKKLMVGMNLFDKVEWFYLSAKIVLS